MIFKDTKWRCTNYKNWVKSLPCCVSGEQADDPHHIKGTFDLGVKPSDIWTMPLTRKLHTELHDIGYNAWEAKYGSQLEFCRRTIDQAVREGILNFGKVSKQ